MLLFDGPLLALGNVSAARNDIAQAIYAHHLQMTIQPSLSSPQDDPAEGELSMIADISHRSYSSPVYHSSSAQPRRSTFSHGERNGAERCASLAECKLFHYLS